MEQKLQNLLVQEGLPQTHLVVCMSVILKAGPVLNIWGVLFHELACQRTYFAIPPRPLESLFSRAVKPILLNILLINLKTKSRKS
jgi:hypothetical protein